MTKQPTSFAEAVANGAQALDDRYPGWWRHIDVARLSTASIDRCVCGQLDSHYNPAREPSWAEFAQNLTNSFAYENYGFRTIPSKGTWDDLNAEWRLVIQARLDADKLPVADEQKEAVLA